MEDIIFKNINAFWLLIIIPFLFLIFALIRNIRKKQLNKLGNTKVINQLIIENSNFRPWLKFIILNLALIFLIFALARPQFATETKVKSNENNEIIIAMDISNSMLAKAKKSGLSRLDLSKNAIINLLDNLNNEKVGLVVFAGKAAVQIPITHDYSAFRLILKSINPSYLTAQGTNIAEAIDLSRNAFTPNKNNTKSIIIISDGEDHKGNINAAIDKVKQNGIKVYTVGIGSARGEPIYIKGKVLKDKSDNIVMSKLNETVLRKIAKNTDAEYINFSSNYRALKDIYQKTNKTDENGDTKIAKFDDKYHYFVFPAIILLFIEFFILLRRNRWLSKINIFNKNLT